MLKQAKKTPKKIYVAGIGKYSRSKGYGEYDKKVFTSKQEAIRFAKNTAKDNEVAYVRGSNGLFVFKAKKTPVKGHKWVGK